MLVYTIYIIWIYIIYFRLCLKVRGRSASYLLYGCAQLRFFRFQDSSCANHFTIFHPKRPRPAALCKCSSMVVNDFSPVRPQLWKRVTPTIGIQMFDSVLPEPWCTTVIIVQKLTTNYTIRKPKRYSHRPFEEGKDTSSEKHPFFKPFLKTGRIDTVEYFRNVWNVWNVLPTQSVDSNCLYDASNCSGVMQLRCIVAFWCHLIRLILCHSVEFCECLPLLHNSLVSLHSRWMYEHALVHVLGQFWGCFSHWSEVRGDLWHFLPRTLRWDRHRRVQRRFLHPLHKSFFAPESNVVQDTYHWFVPAGQHGMMLGWIVARCVTLQSKPYEGHEHFVDVDCTDVVTPKT